MKLNPYEEAPTFEYDEKNHTLYMKGNSYLEHAADFYEKHLVEWLKGHADVKDLIVHIHMGYMNTPTQKFFGFRLASLKGKIPLPEVKKIVVISDPDLENDDVVNIAYVWGKSWGVPVEEIEV